MSKQSRGSDRSYNPTQGNTHDSAHTGAGSVKRARQRVEAGLPLEMPQSIRDTPPGGSAAVLPSRTTRLRLEPSNPPHLPPKLPSLETSFSGDLNSRPGRTSEKPPTSEQLDNSTPQWPLRQEDQSHQSREKNSPIEERAPTRGTPPQRPPRPAYVPSILDSSKRENAPLFHHRQPQIQPQLSQRSARTQPLYWSNSFAIYDPDPGPPTASTGFSGSSGLPSNSSGATIPDFPSPGNIPLLPPQQIRRPPNLGPPPSSRRGASSYYLQSSHVTPIPEEQPESATQNSHGSFASSHVIPTSWGDGPPEYYLGEEDDDDITEGEDGRLSRGTDDGESSNLVRKASMGKRHKPSLTTIRSSEGLVDKDSQVGKGGTANTGSIGQAVTATSAVGAFAASLGPTPRVSENFGDDSEFQGGTGLLDASTSSNDSTIMDLNAIPTDSPVHQRSRSPVSANIDPRVREIMGGLQKGGALESGVPSPLTSTSQTSLDEKSLKRPPKLNMDGTRETDTRGSLTSLPDLIRRATRLASNLDRGKTASRLGMIEMFNGTDLSEKDRAGTLYLSFLHDSVMTNVADST